MTATPPAAPPAPASLVAAARDGARLDHDLGAAVAGDYGDPTGEYLALRRGAGVVDRSHTGVVVVTGPEARSFLDSLMSQALTDLAPGTGAHALLLQPQGKLTADTRALAVADDEVWLLCEAGVGPELAAALHRFRIRVKAEVDDRSASWGALAVEGPEAAGVVARALAVDVPADDLGHVEWRDARVVRADWPGVARVEVVGPADALEAAWAALVGAGAVPAGLEASEAVRIEAGVPRQGLDVDTSTIPQEAFLEERSVSFTKGCFLGQELVCRIDSRGHVNKLLRGVVLTDTVRPPVGAEVVVARGPAGGEEGGAGGGAAEKVVGALTSIGQSLDLRAVVALATVRREVEPPAPVTLRWTAPDGSTATARAEVRALPLLTD